MPEFFKETTRKSPGILPGFVPGIVQGTLAGVPARADKHENLRINREVLWIFSSTKGLGFIPRLYVSTRNNR